jgi:uncharacterized membrane protein
MPEQQPLANGPATGPASEPATGLSPAPAPDAKPFLIPCRQLDTWAPLEWVRLGWRDFCRAPALSLAYGSVVVLISWAVTLLALRFGGWVLLMAMLSGFVFIAPVIAIGLYAIARQLDEGRKPTLAEALASTRRAFGNAMVFSLILLVVFLVWARAASAISIFLPMTAGATVGEYVAYFGVGTAVGTIFAAITFATSAFALPLIADGEADSVTAIVTSINAVLRSQRAMGVWAGLIVGLTSLGLATGFMGLAVVVPILGYAAWHGRRATLCS